MNAQSPGGAYKMTTRVEPETDGEPLYAVAKQVYPQSVRGFYRRVKWIVLLVTLGIYYFLPFFSSSRPSRFSC
jgi:hypothetical protein